MRRVHLANQIPQEAYSTNTSRKNHRVQDEKTAILTGWATRHCARCARPSVKLEAGMHELELASTHVSSTTSSSFVKIAFLKSTVSGVHSCT
eukprot:m.510137 g.510137  ORF g.510137 m.510137 type:complete len:92 (+) comp57413_c0_seq19:682-957(+)